MGQMISASEFAIKLGVSAERVTQLCKSGRISGAEQFVMGSMSVWMIPDQASDPRKGNGRPRKVSTMRPSQKLYSHRDSVLSIAAKMGMSNVRVFGSIARGEDTDNSDVDLLVDAPDNATLLDMVKLKYALELEIGTQVDVLTPDDLPNRSKIAVLQEALPL